MSKGRIYIAGKMSGLKWYGFHRFDAAKAHLEHEGWTVVSPADIDREHGLDPFKLPEDHDWHSLPEGFDLRSCIKRDLDALLTCDAIFMLEGWETSKGARTERAVAEWLGLKVATDLYWSCTAIFGGPTEAGWKLRWADEDQPAPETILDEAKRITSGDRNGSYGHPADHWQKTVGMVNALYGTAFKPEDWGKLMALDKLARDAHSPKRDNAVDVCGYLRCIERVRARKGVSGYAA